MLTIIDSKPKHRRFLTYDLEWIPGEELGKKKESDSDRTAPLELRICGVYDGERYRCYQSIDSFLNNELTNSNRGAWFYGHAGGLADLGFVLGAIKRLMISRGYQVSAKFSGSSAIIVKVRRNKHVWYFIDSYWLLRDKLENIAKWIGTEKGAKEHRKSKMEAKLWYATAPLSELMEYNKKDCVILWDAVKQFEEALLDFGGQLQMTLASSAMFLFRRRFLNRDINTSNWINSVSRDSYFASRVEVFTREIVDSLYYDINSSFPHAMTFSCPGEYLGSGNRVPDNEDKIFLVDCTFSVPDCYIPPIPIRHNNKVFFPTGKWRAWLTSIDFRLLIQTGGRIESVHEVLRFSAFDELADYARTIYDKRKRAETDFEKIFYKLLLNSLYGKFAESREKQMLLMNPDEIADEMEMYMPGVWLTTETVDVPHEHVPISTHITAIARRSLYEFLTQCRNVYYCDTDGFCTTDNLSVGPELGELKLEKQLMEAYFKAPKVYRYKGKDGVEVIKAKGFSDMSREKFDRLTDGLDIEFQRMARLKEMFGRFHSQEPIEILIKKCIKAQSMTKRFTYPDGTTRPWTYQELMSGNVAPSFATYNKRR